MILSMQIFRVAAGLDGGTSEACRATFPNVQLRAVGGVSGGHGARLAERHFPNFQIRVVGGD